MAGSPALTSAAADHRVALCKAADRSAVCNKAAAVQRVSLDQWSVFVRSFRGSAFRVKAPTYAMRKQWCLLLDETRWQNAALRRSPIHERWT